VDEKGGKEKNLGKMVRGKVQSEKSEGGKHLR